MSIPSVVTARGQTFNKLSLSLDVEPSLGQVPIALDQMVALALFVLHGRLPRVLRREHDRLSATGAWTEGVGHVTVSPGPANVAAKVKAGPTEMPRVTAPSHLITLLGFSRGRDS